MPWKRSAVALLLAAPGCSLFVDLDGISGGAPSAGDGGVDAGAVDAGADADGTSGAKVVRRITFEDGALVNPSSGADQLEGAPQLESARPISGGFSARIVGTNGSGVSFFRCDLPQPAGVVITFAIRVAALPSGSIRIVRVLGGGETSGEIELSAAGEVGVSTGTSSAIRSPKLPLDVVHLVRVRLDPGGTIEASLAKAGEAFAAPFGSMPLEVRAPVSSIRFGQTVAANYGMDIVFDDVVIEAL